MRTRAVGESALLLLDVIAVLRSHDIAYAVIGALAVAVHGVVRASQDADIVAALTVRDAARVREMFASEGLQVDVRRGDLDDPIQAVVEIKDDFSNRVDVLIGIRGLSKQTFERSIEVMFNGEQMRVVSLSDLIAMKLFAAGPQDLVDAHQLYEANAESIDIEQLRTIAAKYGREALEALEGMLKS